ncbi:MAG: CsgG/HfaB family protein [Desulfovibrio sp.]|uniref:CsgG/HfaB family protein n=1 Tax=Desulfovibrio sp. 7SRBS1 TaxID=3378064 RepID=UPI003B4223A4
MRRLSCIIALTFLALLTACTNSHRVNYVQSREISAHKRFVAVLPLVNLTSHPFAGRIVGDILSSELYAATSFTFMERTAMAEKIKGKDDDLEFVMDKAVAQRLGRELGVDTVVYGSVTEYRYKLGIDQDPVVGINLRLLDVGSGKVLWASSMSKTGGCWFICEDSLNRLAQDVCESMVKEMAGELDGQKS